jgi:glycosyltransferase involved in cell wall biosynthesis
VATEVSPADLDVTVVVPVYNERGHVAAEIDRIRTALDQSHYSYEIVVVDDGSSDGSSEVVAQIPDIRLISFTRNRGSGTARRVGTRAARGRIVVWTDADMTYPNERIPELVKELESGYDQVVGARTSEQGTHRFFRVPAKWFVRRLAMYLTKTDIPDLNSGLRAFRRDVALQYLHLLPTGFSCVTTITMSFLANGYSIKYVPIEYAPRAGESKFHWRRDTSRYLLQVVRMVLSYEPLRVFLPLGFVLALVGTGKLVYDVNVYDWHITPTTLLILITGFQAWAIGLVADLIVRVTKPQDAVEPASSTTYVDLPAL